MILAHSTETELISLLHTDNTHTSAFISTAFNIHDERASGGDVKYCML